ncbi:MAG: DUF1887 family CARF protein [Candidatus Cloacimonas sp.]|jgi:hypothetical protein|nr:DUF1887 family CARF protein [Candidatus Cloacimonas sp.]
MKILVSLVSEQTIPNILLIKSLSGIDRYLFISTQLMKDSGRREWICAVCNICDYDEILVKEHSYADIIMHLNALVTYYPSDTIYVVNITGGTKIMALATCDHFRKAKAQILYIPPQQTHAQLIHPSAIEEFVPLTYSLDALEYLKAYGISVEPISPITNHTSFLDKVFGFIAQSPNRGLAQIINNLGNKYADCAGTKEVVHHFASLLNIHPDQVLEPAWLQFIKGKWFEEYLTYWISQCLPEARIYTNIKISKDNVQNELDLTFAYANTLYVIEAKTAVKLPAVKDYLYKLDSLRRDFGLFPRCFLSIADSNNEADWLRAKIFQQRSQKMKIPVLSFSDLTPSTIQNTIMERVIIQTT